MPRGIMVVQSNPATPERDAEYNDWYSSTHLPELLQIPGFVAGRRYRVPDGAPATHRYLAIYDIDADELTAPMKELQARSARGEVGRSDVVGMDPPPVITFYEFLEEG